MSEYEARQMEIGPLNNVFDYNQEFILIMNYGEYSYNGIKHII